MSRLLTDDSEVVLKQSGETEEAMKQEGLLSSRRKEKTEFETCNLTMGPVEKQWNLTGQARRNWKPLGAE